VLLPEPPGRSPFSGRSGPAAHEAGPRRSAATTRSAFAEPVEGGG